ncbi:helix-turn-helix transcriptional regulator [Microbaculum marinum]|uniref:Helix-turn-helix transcriptional regulator n=1 Tax=Microbaculum marinum TaxID=1764581 RepID=A0AAW9RH59_9HYPH
MERAPAGGPAASAAARSRDGRETVLKLRRILEQRYEERITLHDLSDALDLSPFQTLRVFQRHCGITPHQYLVRYRVEQATRLLRDGEPIAEVAAQVGFTDQSHMTKHFKKLLGMTPSRYRTSANWQFG